MTEGKKIAACKTSISDLVGWNIFDIWFDSFSLGLEQQLFGFDNAQTFPSSFLIHSALLNKTNKHIPAVHSVNIQMYCLNFHAVKVRSADKYKTKQSSRS